MLSNVSLWNDLNSFCVVSKQSRNKCLCSFRLRPTDRLPTHHRQVANRSPTVGQHIDLKLDENSCFTVGRQYIWGIFFTITCTANQFPTVQITVQHRCLFVLLFGWYSLQLDNKSDCNNYEHAMIRNIIYLNLGERYEDMIHHHSYKHDHGFESSSSLNFFRLQII